MNINNNVRTDYLHTQTAGRRSALARGPETGSFVDRIKNAGAKGNEAVSAGDEGFQKDDQLQTTEEMMRFIGERKQEILTKVRKGETEVKIRIGAQEFTEKEWDKLIESFDEAEEDIRKKLREAREQQRKAMAERAGEAGSEEEADDTLIERLLADRDEAEKVV